MIFFFFQLSADFDVFFAGELNPVAPKAQKKVPVPEGLDLDAWINEPPPEEESESEDDDIDDLATKNDVFGIKGRIFTFSKSMNIIGYIHHFYHFQVQHQVMIVHQRKISWNQQKRNYRKFVNPD